MNHCLSGSFAGMLQVQTFSKSNLASVENSYPYFHIILVEPIIKAGFSGRLPTAVWIHVFI